MQYARYASSENAFSAKYKHEARASESGAAAIRCCSLASSEHVANDIAVHIGQPEVAAVVAERSGARGPHPKGAESWRAGREHVTRPIHYPVAEFVGSAVVGAPAHTATCKPCGESMWVVVAPLRASCASDVRPNSPPQTSSVESNRPRCFRSAISAADRLVDLGCKLSVVLQECRHGHPNSLRWMFPHYRVWINRTPCSTSRRAIRHCMAKCAQRGSCIP